MYNLSPYPSPGVWLQDPKHLLEKKRRERAYARVLKEKQEPAGEHDSAERFGPLLDRYNQLEKRIRDLERKHTALLRTVRVSTLARQSYQSASGTQDWVG